MSDLSAPPRAPLTPDEVQAALDLLEPWSTEPGSLALHDAIYALGEAPAPWERLEAACARHPRHPALPALRERLGLGGEAAPPPLSDVLSAHGPLPEDGDLVAEVGRRLRRAAEVRGILEDRIAGLEAELGSARRLANGVAFVGAMVAVLALLGWLAALGVWELDWIEPPAPPPADAGSEPG